MSRPIIPVFHSTEPKSESVNVPDASANLFDRIIRNPTARNRPMRELRCAEMLCAVLLNCPQLRISIFEELASLCGWQGLPLSELEYEIDTEQAIGSKRDDLRIEGYESKGDERLPVLLWTIEIKVQAGIHFSSREEFSETSEDFAADENVTQIENYDSWLRTREVIGDKKAGIVLAIPLLSEKVAKLKAEEKLSQQWHCLRWTDLGHWIESKLEERSIPESEGLVARHLLGFILQHLQDPTEMAEHRINIDDLAMIRAFAVQGRSCEKRIDNLVAPLLQVFEQTGIKFYESTPTHQRTLFKSTLRSMVYGHLLGNLKSPPHPSVAIFAGVRQDDARVWIESNPRSSIRGRINAVCEERFDALKARNESWYMPSADESSWKMVIRSKPLAWILVEEDQAAAFTNFITESISDLQGVGIIQALQMLGDENA